MKTSLDHFIDGIIRLTSNRSFPARYRLGLGILLRKFHKIRNRIKSDHLPTVGFREGLSKNGQGGEMYRHLYFHLACYLLGPLGWLLSWLAGLTDLKQAATGRAESETEVRDNLAGRECGRVLTSFMKGHLDEDSARRKLREILG